MTIPGRVSIGIPTLNRSGMAYRSIVSALTQTYDNIEVVVSDDASTDDTIQRLDEIQSERLRLFKQEQRLGLVANFDFCLRNATGEYFLLLGDDDELLPTAIERLVTPYLKPTQGVSPEDIGAVWCPCIIANGDGRQMWITEGGPAVESSASMIAGLLAGNRGSRLSSILVRTDDAVAVGGYEKRHGDHCDLGNWGRAALLRKHIVCVNEPLVQYREHHGSTTSGSSIRKWHDWASIMHADLLVSARASGDPQALRLIQSSKSNLICGITLSILIQSVGKKGWIRNAVRQVVGNPGIFFSRYMFHRATKDGWKLLKMRNK